METAYEKIIYKEGDIIRFMTNQPQVHVIEMFGHCEFNPNDVKQEEYRGRIKSVIKEGAFYLMDTLSPMEGFICIAAQEDILGRLDFKDLTKKEQKHYKERDENYEAPNLYLNGIPSEGEASSRKIKATVRKAMKALFPDLEIASIELDEPSLFSKEWYNNNMDYFLGREFRSERTRKRMQKMRNDISRQIEKARFKEFRSVNLGVKMPLDEEHRKMMEIMAAHFKENLTEDLKDSAYMETEYYIKNFLVAVDSTCSQVSIMRDIDERTSFLTFLGPEFHRMKEAAEYFRDKCLRALK